MCWVAAGGVYTTASSRCPAWARRRDSHPQGTNRASRQYPALLLPLPPCPCDFLHPLLAALRPATCLACCRVSCVITGCNMRPPSAPLMRNRCSLTRGTRPSAFSQWPSSESMHLPMKPSQIDRHTASTPAAGRSSEGSLWCSSENGPPLTPQPSVVSGHCLSPRTPVAVKS